MIDWVGLDSGAEAALAVPEGPARGAVVVAGELFGVTEYVVGIVQHLADTGYVAAAPDFYWRAQRRAVLGYDEAGRERGFALLGTLTDETVVADVAAARALVRDRAGDAGGTAMLGFSMGGHLALLAASRLPFDLVATCYAPWTLYDGAPLSEPHPPLDDAEALAEFGTEYLGIIGDQDHIISRSEWQQIERRLTDAGVTHELVSYPGRPHGFLCPDRPATYHADATADVWQRLDAALARRVARTK